MTIQQALKEAAQKLKKAEIDSPALDAEVLLGFVLKKPKEFLFSHSEHKIDKIQGIKYKKLIRRRAKSEPVAYLTGHKEFYGLDFKVNRSVLIPRPETELIIDEIKNLLTFEPFNHLNIIDIGTGSGCIPIAIAKTMKQCDNVTMKCFATDISPAALRVARANARCHGVKIKFLQGDLLKPLIHNSKFIIHHSRLIITANLPYLTPQQCRQESSIQFEPKSALVGGRDGLKYFRELFFQIKKSNCYMLHAKCYMIIEIDPSQPAKIKKLARKYLPQSKIEIKKDFGGQDRMILIKTYPQMQN